MTWTPKMRLYTPGGSLIYTFPLVQFASIPGQPPRKIVVIEGQRGKGAITIDGGQASYDIEIRGILMIDGATEGYQELTAKITEMDDTIQVDQPYVLRLDKTSTTYFEYKVKLIEKVDYPPSLRNTKQEYIIRFLANSW